MFIATVHKAERKTVVESALVSSVIGVQRKGFSPNFFPFLGPWSHSANTGQSWLELLFYVF